MNGPATSITHLRVLMVEDSPDDAELIGRALRKGGLDVERHVVATAAAFRAAIGTFEPDIVLADWSLPGFSGAQAVAIAADVDPALPCILVSGTLGEELVVQALRAGATDYVLKHRLEALAPAVRRAIAEAAEHRDRLRLETELQAAQASMRRSLDAMADAFMICSSERDASGAISGFRVEFANRAAGDFMGVTSGALIGELVPGSIPDLDGTPFLEVCRRVVETNQSFNGEGIELAFGGSAAPVSVINVQVVKAGDGFFTSWRDITEREALRHEREHLAAAVEQASDGVVIFDQDGRLSYANQAFQAWSGRPGDDLAGVDASELINNATGQDAFPRFLEAALAGKPWNEAFDQLGPEGSISHIEIRMSPIRGESGTVTSYVAFVSDVTHLREAEAELALEARVRASLSEALHAIPVAATVAEAAQTICDQLVTLPFIGLAAVEAFLGPGQVEMIARSAPDGFPFLVGTRLPPARAAIVQERSGHGPWAQYVTGDAADGWTDQDLAVGLKALAYGPIAHGEHISGVLVIGTLDDAFARVLVEKLPGIVSFSTASSALLADRMRLMRQSSDLRAGIEQVLAAHAFRPVFQPIVDLASGEVMGYEALTRFDSGQRPDRCFADAWSVGLGQELEVATLGAAVRESSALPANAWLALNVSPRMLRDPERLRDVVSVAERPLVIEVTEHEAIPDYDAIRESVRAIGRDVRLAVDDAGAGVANFNHIIDLRPDFVKLDMSLVRRVHVDLGRQAMVVGMRHFSRTAGCRLLAEGVETAEEARALRALGVEFAQGYHFGRPALVDALRDATSEAAT